MFKIVIASIIFIHGAIHFIGFIKAFNLSKHDYQLTLSVSRTMGIWWLLVGLLFFLLGFLYVTGYKEWFVLGLALTVISQVLILLFWSDAKAASIVNLLIITVALVTLAELKFENGFKNEVREALIHSATSESTTTISQSDLDHLPPMVTRYLEYVGVVGKPITESVKVEMEGEMRSKNGAWFRFTSEQFNFYSDPARMFFMKAKMNGLPVFGYHSYDGNSARMKVKLLSLFPVSELSGKELFKAETVTYFNDLCIFAPSRLIDKNIQWTSENDTTALAIFKNNNVSISAKLIFNQQGQLVNFISDDRLEISEMKEYRFSTPLNDYKKINGYNLPTYGEAIWHFPEGDFVYGKFQVKEVQYNISQTEQ